ncbi:MAG: hypothetical protein V4675_09245 [Verrucomicrobiota bacterium]
MIAGVFLLPMAASACPLCNTETGQQVRAGLFNDEFWPTFLMVLLPFPVLLILLAAMHSGLTRLDHRSSSRNST